MWLPFQWRFWRISLSIVGRCEFSLSIEELSWSVLIVWFLFVQFPCKWRLGFEVNQENSLLKIKLLWDFHAVVMPLEDIEESKGWVGIAKWMNERRLEVDRWSRFKLWFHRMRYRIYTLAVVLGSWPPRQDDPRPSWLVNNC